ncbi:MAG: hypothetical protein ACW96U_12300, partial [Candidatus Heimdallarchaeaceae archaeon]
LYVGVFFDNKKIRSNEWKTELESFSSELAEIFPYPIEFIIINEAPLEHQVDAVRGSLLSCSDEEERTRFLEEILKD